MIQTLVQRLEDRLDFREIADPADMWVNLSLKVNRDTKRMAVQSPAFMTFGHVRQEVGRLERKLFKNFQNVQL